MKKDKPPGKFVSLGAWFDSPEVANWMSDNDLLVGKRYIKTVGQCEIKRKSYFDCQGFGQLAWSCKPRCGHCGDLHELLRCPPGIQAGYLDRSVEHPRSGRQ